MAPFLITPSSLDELSITFAYGSKHEKLAAKKLEIHIVTCLKSAVSLIHIRSLYV